MRVSEMGLGYFLILVRGQTFLPDPIMAYCELNYNTLFSFKKLQIVKWLFFTTH